MNKRLYMLTIGIPVYNGGSTIGETLQSIFSQDDVFGKNKIEVFISDNASTDNTGEVVEEFRIKYPDIIRYTKNIYNIGFDRNVNNIFQLAKGEYVQILGDDDYFVDNNSLSYIIELIRYYQYVDVFLLSIKLLDVISNKFVYDYQATDDMILKSGNEFWSKIQNGAMAVSSLVIRRQSWNNAPMYKYFDTQWIHIGALIEILQGQSNSYVVSRPSIIVRYNVPRWVRCGNELMIAIKYVSVLSNIRLLDYKNSTYLTQLKNRYPKFYYLVMNSKPDKYFERIKVLLLMIPLFYSFPSFWLFQIPALFMPKIITSNILKYEAIFVNGMKVVYKKLLLGQR